MVSHESYSPTMVLSIEPMILLTLAKSGLSITLRLALIFPGVTASQRDSCRLKRCAEDNSDVQMALLMLRNTPRDEELQSSNQRLMNRILRSPVPATDAVLKPRVIKNVAETLLQRRQQQKEYADRGAAKAPEYQEEQAVVVQDTKSRLWEEGRINERLEQPRSYIVRLANGRVVRRNVRDIKCKKRSSDTDDQEVLPPGLITTRYHHPDEDPAAFPAFQPTEDYVEDQQLDGSGNVSPPNTLRTRSGRVVRPHRDSDFEYY